MAIVRRLDIINQNVQRQHLVAYVTRKVTEQRTAVPKPRRSRVQGVEVLIMKYNDVATPQPYTAL